MHCICRVFVSAVVVALIPSIAISQTQNANSEPFVTTYGDLKAADLPICGQIPEELKAQIWFGTPVPLSDSQFVAMFGDNASMFGVRGGDWWYMRETQQVLPLEEASRLEGLEFAKFYRSDEYDHLPVLCGAIPETRLADIREARTKTAAAIAAEAAPKKADPNCIFCELSGGEYLNAIYEGDYDKQDRMAFDYLMEIRRNDTNDAMMGVFMQNVGLQSENLTVLQELLGNYMQKYAYHDTECLRPGSFKFTVTWDTPDVVTTINGWEFARKEGLHLSNTFQLNKEFLQACNQLCGDAGSMTAAAGGLNMTGTRYALMDIFIGLDEVFERYNCATPEIKKFEKNLLALFDRENRIPSDAQRNTLLDVAFVPNEFPDPERFAPDERIFPEMAERRELVALEGNSARARGSRFLVSNAALDGVQISDSGLQYQIVSPGSGTNPTRFSMTTFHYRMTTVDGDVLADTWVAGEPATAPVNGLVDGWAEGLELLKLGGEARLVIPPYLAYGDQEGIGIEPGSVLVVDIELLNVQ